MSSQCLRDRDRRQQPHLYRRHHSYRREGLEGALSEFTAGFMRLKIWSLWPSSTKNVGGVQALLSSHSTSYRGETITSKLADVLKRAA
jgi:hypothetical protein